LGRFFEVQIFTRLTHTKHTPVDHAQANADLALPTAKSGPVKIYERPSFWYLVTNRFAKKSFCDI